MHDAVYRQWAQAKLGEQVGAVHLGNDAAELGPVTGEPVGGNDVDAEHAAVEQFSSRALLRGGPEAVNFGVQGSG
jgi:hypothetical protein